MGFQYQHQHPNLNAHYQADARSYEQPQAAPVMRGSHTNNTNTQYPTASFASVRRSAPSAPRSHIPHAQAQPTKKRSFAAFDDTADNALDTMPQTSSKRARLSAPEEASRQTDEAGTSDVVLGNGLEDEFPEIEWPPGDPSDDLFTTGWDDPLPETGSDNSTQLPNGGSTSRPAIAQMSPSVNLDYPASIRAAGAPDLTQENHQVINECLTRNPDMTTAAMPAASSQRIPQQQDMLPAIPQQALYDVTKSRQQFAPPTNAMARASGSVNTSKFTGTKRRFEDAIGETGTSFPEKKFLRMASPFLPPVSAAARSGMVLSVSALGYAQLTFPRPNSSDAQTVAQNDIVNAHTISSLPAAATSSTVELLPESTPSSSSTPQDSVVLETPDDQTTDEGIGSGSAAEMRMPQLPLASSITMKRNVRDHDDAENKSTKRRKMEVAAPSAPMPTPVPEQLSLTNVDTDLVAQPVPEHPGLVNGIVADEAIAAARLQAEIVKMNQDAAKETARKDFETGLDAIATVLSHSALVELYHPDARPFLRKMLQWTPSEAVHMFFDARIPSYDSGRYPYPKAVNALRVTREVMRFTKGLPFADAYAEAHSTLLARSERERRNGVNMMTLNTRDFDTVEDAERHYADNFFLI